MTSDAHSKMKKVTGKDEQDGWGCRKMKHLRVEHPTTTLVFAFSKYGYVLYLYQLSLFSSERCTVT